MNNPIPEMLTVSETKQLYRLSHSTLYRLIGDGNIEAVKVGRSTLIVRASVASFFQKQPRVGRAA